MMFDEFALDVLRDNVKNYMSVDRYIHTLGVERAAERIGRILINDSVYELRAAALLHDIAKDIPKDRLAILAKDYLDNISDEDLNTPSALHSFAAPSVILREFPNFATDNILKSVSSHTLGDPNMSIFDKIIYIADYVEDGRKFKSCEVVRSFLFDSLSEENNMDENYRVLNRAIVMSIDNIVLALNSRGEKINSRSINTRKALLDNI